MKQIVVIVVVLALILGFIPLGDVVYAVEEPEYVNVRVDGKNINVKKINILINGQPIDSDVPPVLYKERTLVPIRFVAQHLNAKISWSQEKYEATIETENKKIVLKIDSSEVMINGKKTKLPYNVPAKLINDRTMVPLRFVSEALGFEIGWNAETWTGFIDFPEQEVVDISVDDGGDYLPKIVIETTGMIAHKVTELESPYRIVIDVLNTRLDLDDEDKLDDRGLLNTEINKYPIKEIRASQFSNDPHITRLVVELDRFVGYTINTSDDNKNLEISFINKVKDISVETIDDRTGIVIKNTNTPEYNVLRLSNPDRIVLDLLDSFLVNDKYEYNIETDFVNKIRTSQFKPDSLYNPDDKIVRVVFDVKEFDNRPNLSTELKDNKLIVFIDNKDIQNFQYEKTDTGGQLRIDAVKETKYYTDYDKKENKLQIRVHKDNVDLYDGMKLVNDELVRSIAIEEVGEFKNIDIRLKKDIIYDILSDTRDDKIRINFAGKSDNYNGKLVVIDAGHGGKDPGAISPTYKYKEKDMNLDVARKLESKLQALGFKTLMIRDDDRYVGLYDRANIANAYDGDVFVSIHFNAAENSSIAGIQTLYCPSYLSDVKQDDNFPFAEAVHTQLLEELGLADKRIERRPKIVVVRETKMPAALVELGFLTNPQEEKRIVTNKYREEAAEAIANGIVNYFK